MKLAEALLLQADRSLAFEELKDRAQAVARYQEGEEPVEDAGQLIAEAEDAASDLEWLAGRVNRTVSSVELPDGRLLTDAMAQRDGLRARISLLTAVADAAMGRATGAVRQARSELKFVAAVPVASLRESADKLTRMYRELDVAIQKVNWAVDLVED
jgi:phage-related tail protein